MVIWFSWSVTRSKSTSNCSDPIVVSKKKNDPSMREHSDSNLNRYSSDHFLALAEHEVLSAAEQEYLQNFQVKLETNEQYLPLWKTTCPWHNPPKVARMLNLSTSRNYESEFYLLIGEIVRLNAERGKPCVSIDAGVNIGQETLQLAHLGCKVYGYEALLSNYRTAYSRVKLFNLSDRVVLLYGALHNTCQDEIVIAFNDNNGQLRWKADPKDAERGTVVFTRRIDDDVKEDVLLFKIDIEGNEAWALDGAKRLLGCYNVPFLIVEFSPNGILNSGYSPKAMLRLMLSFGYEIFVTPCTHNLYHEIFSLDTAHTKFTCDSYPSPDLKDRESNLAYLLNIVLNPNQSDMSARRKLELRDEDIENFVETLMRHADTYKCCLVNLLFFNRHAYNNYQSR